MAPDLWECGWTECGADFHAICVDPENYSYQGKCHSAQIVDECPGCARGSLDSTFTVSAPIIWLIHSFRDVTNHTIHFLDILSVTGSVQLLCQPRRGSFPNDLDSRRRRWRKPEAYDFTIRTDFHLPPRIDIDDLLDFLRTFDDFFLVSPAVELVRVVVRRVFSFEFGFGYFLDRRYPSELRYNVESGRSECRKWGYQ